MAYYFPAPNERWWKYDNQLERKFAKDDLTNEAPVFRQVISAFHSKRFVEFLQDLTGIPGLITDHTLRGGGLHQIARGGSLAIHADFNQHPELMIQRRLNLLLYLNKEWLPGWRGDLELWNEDMSRCVQSISPMMGKVVVFSTTDTAWHGHPDSLLCPEGITRKSMALYYYTASRPEHERSAPHSTIYVARPQDAKDPETEALRAKRARGRL